MHSLRRTVGAVIVAMCCISTAPAGAAGLPPTVVQQLVRAGLPREAVGIVVQDTASGRIVVEHSADQPFAPASVMKLVTTLAGLDVLGPAYAWRTQAWTTAKQSGQVLDGDLIIKGGGDPRLLMEHLSMFLRQLRARGIREIRGNLVLDRSWLRPEALDPAQFDNGPDRPYNALPDALLLNFRSLTVRLLPDVQAGLVRVSTEPPVASWPVAAPLLGEGPCNDWRGQLRMRSAAQGLAMDGEYPSSCGERSIAMHAWQMSADAYFGAVFRQLWSELGGSLAGQVLTGAVPAEARLLDEWTSPPLLDAVRDINKYSNNVMARQLFLSVGAQAAGLPADTNKAALAIHDWLRGRGVAAPGLVLDNGSGLSRSERITPRTLADLLGWAWRSPLMPEFVSSLPLTGLDGTMRNRLRNSPAAGHVKTGSLADVRSVAGYIQAASGKRYVVVGIINHAQAGAAMGALDALLQWVVEQG